MPLKPKVKMSFTKYDHNSYTKFYSIIMFLSLKLNKVAVLQQYECAEDWCIQCIYYGYNYCYYFFVYSVSSVIGLSHAAAMKLYTSLFNYSIYL